MAAIGWDQIQAALAAWVLTSTGLPVGSVIWSYPGTTDDPGARPVPPYAALTLTDVRTIAQAAETREDEGAKIKRTFSRPYTATLELQLFADKGSGEQGAVARLHEAFAALDLPEHIEALDAAGVGLGYAGEIRLVAGRLNKLLEPRAVGEVALHLESVVESYADYIARVTGTAQVDGDSLPFETVFEPDEES